jgi:predicted RNA-binding protein with PIN domain
MSLLYVIDGYNIIKHPQFAKQLPKKIQDSRIALSDFIRVNKLCGSRNNKIVIVFDGYQDSMYTNPDTEIEVIFSRRESADERIKSLVSDSGNVKNMVVVSDDKEIKFFAKSCGALVRGIEEFLNLKEKAKQKQEDSFKPELNYSQIHKINQELRNIWLKE